MGSIAHGGIVYGGSDVVANPQDSATDTLTKVGIDGTVYDIAGGIPVSEKGAANGVAELDSNGLVPSTQLPSYVDDIIEGYLYDGTFYEDSAHTTAITPEDGKIYVDKSTDTQWRWGGSAYTQVSKSLALGETATTAYAGNKGAANATAIASLQSGKVDKVSGKGLSTNDYTTEEKNKLSGIATGAEVNVQANWNESNSSSDAYIQNKPTIPTVQNKTITIKLNGTTIGDFTLNQSTDETIDIQVTKSDVGLSDVGNFKAVSTAPNQDLSTTEQSNARANIGAGTSSFSGSYSDLSNKPTLGTAAAKDVASSGNASTTQVVMGNDTRLTDARNAADVSAWAKASTKPTYTASEVGLGNVPNVTTDNQTPTVTEATTRANLATGDTLKTIIGKIKKFFTDLKTVAFTGSYNDLTDKPSIPSGQIQSDWTQTTTTAVDYIKHKPSLATVATSGSYTDLSNKPTIPAAQVNSDWNASSGVAQILNKPTIPAAQIQSDWSQTTTTALDYIKNKPTIPTVNNGTLTIKQNGTSKGTFTANQSGNTEVALTDTTYESKTAASGGTAVSLVTTGEKYTWNNKSNFSGSYNDLTNKPTIPAAQVNSDWNASSGVAQILNKPTLGDLASINIDGASSTKFLKGDGTWDSVSGGAVTGVKGNSESTYRTGNVNITAANVGALPTSGGTMTGEITLSDLASGIVPASDGGAYIGTSDKRIESINANAVYSKAFVLASGNSYGSIYPPSSGLTANRTLRIPNESGTFATQEWVASNVKVQYNSFTTSGNSSGWEYKTITFSTAYKSVPLISVMCNMGATAPNNDFMIDNYSKTGFRFGRYAKGSGQRYVWFAIGVV